RGGAAEARDRGRSRERARGDRGNILISKLAGALTTGARSTSASVIRVVAPPDSGRERVELAAGGRGAAVCDGVGRGRRSPRRSGRSVLGRIGARSGCPSFSITF